MFLVQTEYNLVSKSFIICHHHFLNKNDFLARHTHTDCLECDSNQFTNRLCSVSVSENKTG